MRPRPGNTRSRSRKIKTPILSAAPLFLLLVAVGAVAWWAIDHAPSPVRADGAGAAPPPPNAENAALVAPKTQSLAPKSNERDLGAYGNANGLEVTGVQARHIRYRSPLESSPGYYPPADPESLSVITGRRDAPEVSLELSGGAASLDDLARAFLAGVVRKDERALHALRVTRAEFEAILWPEFPQSRPITHIPVSEAWGFETASSLAGASRAIGSYGGRPLTFLRADYARAETFRNFNLLRDVRILIRDPRDGRAIGLAYLPSVVERHGRYKALIFKD
jgi:hypothetical protein